MFEINFLVCYLIFCLVLALVGSFKRVLIAYISYLVDFISLLYNAFGNESSISQKRGEQQEKEHTKMTDFLLVLSMQNNTKRN